MPTVFGLAGFDGDIAASAAYFGGSGFAPMDDLHHPLSHDHRESDPVDVPAESDGEFDDETLAVHHYMRFAFGTSGASSASRDFAAAAEAKPEPDTMPTLYEQFMAETHPLVPPTTIDVGSLLTRSLGQHSSPALPQLISPYLAASSESLASLPETNSSGGSGGSGTESSESGPAHQQYKNGLPARFHGTCTQCNKERTYCRGLCRRCYDRQPAMQERTRKRQRRYNRSPKGIERIRRSKARARDRNAAAVLLEAGESSAPAPTAGAASLAH